MLIEKKEIVKSNPENKWTTKDGTEIDISKMSGHHLTSAIDYLVKMEKAIRPKSMKEYEKSLVTLRFNTNYPLEIVFGICKHGIGRYLLAPRVESEVR